MHTFPFLTTITYWYRGLSCVFSYDLGARAYPLPHSRPTGRLLLGRKRKTRFLYDTISEQIGNVYIPIHLWEYIQTIPVVLFLPVWPTMRDSKIISPRSRSNPEPQKESYWFLVMVVVSSWSIDTDKTKETTVPNRNTIDWYQETKRFIQVQSTSGRVTLSRMMNSRVCSVGVKTMKVSRATLPTTPHTRCVLYLL